MRARAARILLNSAFLDGGVLHRTHAVSMPLRAPTTPDHVLSQLTFLRSPATRSSLTSSSLTPHWLLAPPRARTGLYMLDGVSVPASAATVLITAALPGVFGAGGAAAAAVRTAMEKVANREIRVWHLVIENGYKIE
jgi:hypothetical protein